MQHTFRQSAFHREASVRVADSSLQLLDRSGAVKREISFEEILKLQIYEGGEAVTKDGKSFTYKCTRVFPARGRSILFVSSYYVGLGRRSMVAQDLRSSFDEVLTKLKAEVRDRNPNAILIYGDYGYSILGYVMAVIFALAFLGTLSLPLISIYQPELSPKLGKKKAWGFLLLFLVNCFFFSRFFWSMAQSYAPIRSKISDD